MRGKSTEPLIDLSWTFTFGKYKGDTIQQVIQYDPGYILWCSENVVWFKVETYILNIAQEELLKREMAGHNTWIAEEMSDRMAYASEDIY